MVGIHLRRSPQIKVNFYLRLTSKYKIMNIITIPKKEYKKLLSGKRVFEFTPTMADKKKLERARKNRMTGKFLTLDELKQKLGFTD